MDLTPELLLEAKFSPARRGYDMNEVDDFLERCAEGLDVLLARLKAEYSRAESAEAALVEARAAAPAAPDAGPAPTADGDTVMDAPASGELADPVAGAGDEGHGAPAEPPAPAAPATTVGVEEPMRILIAAERTAEAAINDARAEAERIRAEAESLASTTRSEAETLVSRARAEAEAEAVEAGAQARRSIESEVLALREDRDALSADVRSLRAWLDDQRARMRRTARDLQRLVEGPTSLGSAPLPELLAALDDDGAGPDDPPAAEASGVDLTRFTAAGTTPVPADEDTAAVDTAEEAGDGGAEHDAPGADPTTDGDATQAVPVVSSAAEPAQPFDDEADQAMSRSGPDDVG